MRVGVVGLLHESNTFIVDSPTMIEQFQADVHVAEIDVYRVFEHSPHEIGGFIAGLQSEQVSEVPLFAARATPDGMLHMTTVNSLLASLERALKRARRLDGILAAVHGAAVSFMYPDLDGLILSRLRAELGPDKPLIATLDLHANLSQKMVDAADALIAYRTNPHVDQRERGIEAARLMARTLRGEVRPTMAAAFPRVAINIEKQLTGEPPCRELFALADEMRHEPTVLSNSILLGFPYADVPEMGSSIVVVTDNQPELAQQLANHLAQYIEANRHRFAGEFLTVDDAVRQAMSLAGPVLLLDMGDNVGGGSPGDGTALAHALQSRSRGDSRPEAPREAASSHSQSPRPPRPTSSFVCLADPQAAAQASHAGIGKRLRLTMGGKVETSQGPPLTHEVEVLSLHEGKFTETAVTHGGITNFDQGRTAVVRTGAGLTVMLTSIRTPPFSLRQMTAFGLDPADFHIIVAKGVHAPRAAYEAVCRHCLRVDTPGVTRADMTKLEYRRRRRPLFPFEELPDL